MATGGVNSFFRGDAGDSLDEQLALLAEITQSFAVSLDIDETLHIAIEKFMHYLEAEAASIFLLEEESNELVCRRCAGPVDITGLRLSAGEGIVGRTVATRSSTMVRDVSEDPDFAHGVDENTGFVTRSILCVPLMIRQHCIGALELINKRSGDGLFEERDRYFLVALASAAALAIHNARMADALVGQERLRRELELARRIQEGLLPAPPAEDFPVQGVNIPAHGISGDFYDFFRRDDGLIYFNLADVSGKGMNAALLMARVSSLLHHLARTGDDPGRLLSQLNEELCESASHGMFVTVVNGFVEPRTGVVRLANAGHPPPLLHGTDNAFRSVEAGAPPLGVVPETEFPVSELNLEGGSLYLYTDGVTESGGADGQPLEVTGLMELIRRHAGAAPQRRLPAVIRHLQTGAGGRIDDITMLLIQCNAR